MIAQEKSEIGAAPVSYPGGLSHPVELVYDAIPIELGRTLGPNPMCRHGRSDSTDIEPVAGNVIIRLGSPYIR
jgi:hypothetical protein